jgi:hypothetical protein
VLVTVVGMLVVTAAALRIPAGNVALYFYSNFVHVALVVATLAVLALVACALVAWRSGTRHGPHPDAPTWLAGTIARDGEGDVVGCIEISSWLRGPRRLLRPFTLVTSTGELEVPRGAHLASALPLATTALRTGEATVVLRTGDRVIVGGFVQESVGDHPFRGTRALIPGRAGIAVLAPPRAGDGGYAILALWRPCVAYLAIATVTGLLALAPLALRG